MRLTDPYQVYSEIYCQLLKGNKRLAASNALNKLNAFFTNGDLDKIPTVLLIDELDLLCTRRQNVLYQLFEWATKEEAVLAVLAIANTLDLPERLLNHRVSSRMGMSRLAFQPYNHKEIGEILNSRLKGSACVEEDAVELVSRKVAAVSGDLRKALEVCRRAIDIAMGKNLTHLSIAEVQEAMKQLANTARLDCVKFCSTHERAVLRAVVSEYGKSGNEEITLCDLFRSYSQCTPTLYSVEPLPYEEFAAVCARLSNSYLLVACPGISDWTKRFRLGLPADDINFSLNLSEQKD